MYVVIEWNQASGRPSLYGDEVHDLEVFAEETAIDAWRDARQRGRRERYTVHAVDEDERWDSDKQESD